MLRIPGVETTGGNLGKNIDIECSHMQSGFITCSIAILELVIFVLYEFALNMMIFSSNARMDGKSRKHCVWQIFGLRNSDKRKMVPDLSFNTCLNLIGIQMVAQTKPDRNTIYSVWSNPVPFRQARNAMSTNPSHSFFHHGVPKQSTGHRLFDHDVKATVFGQNHVSCRVLHREIANDHRRHRLIPIRTEIVLKHVRPRSFLKSH